MASQAQSSAGSGLVDAQESPRGNAYPRGAGSRAHRVAHNQEVADDLLQLLQRASTRADEHLKQQKRSRVVKSMQSKRARAQAEALLSTDVLLAIAKDRNDAGHIICSHCSKSLLLADVLPSANDTSTTTNARSKASGSFVIAPPSPKRTCGGATHTVEESLTAAVDAACKEEDFDDVLDGDDRSPTNIDEMGDSQFSDDDASPDY